MSENYKFSQHKKCEYFPCHQGLKEEEFNCLFCYCPLYMLQDKCGGNFKYAQGIKDCSDCTITHATGGYDHVMSKMGMIMKIGSETSNK
ncbi:MULTISPECIES: cysteine-rich small domain-containing protein [unclassified Lentimicrobium]|uniref:cysteine-rich small domain-containing protein n=1 Tax=unclassified Lentimicrobium TaxID=2677434 RepID=UPI0015535561|nr:MULTISPECIES: cysteine-rich small domain-containing protein [unclassified Lentimicrobium]NPD47302.1 metal-binding protein [Lentimicrobium sp. S6]NPD84701.1 metal-binding protein [Lentimicrobium sp. L6]